MEVMHQGVARLAAKYGMHVGIVPYYPPGGGSIFEDSLEGVVDAGDAPAGWEVVRSDQRPISDGCTVDHYLWIKAAFACRSGL